MKNKNKDKYVGVKYDSNIRKFVSSLKFQNSYIRCGSADTAKEAAILRDIQIIKLNLPYSKLQVLKPSL